MLPASPGHQHHISQLHLRTPHKEPRLPSVPTHNSLGMGLAPRRPQQLGLFSTLTRKSVAKHMAHGHFKMRLHVHYQAAGKTAVTQLSHPNAFIKAADFKHKPTGLMNKDVSNHTNLAAFVGYTPLLKGRETELRNNMASLFTPVITEAKDLSSHSNQRKWSCTQALLYHSLNFSGTASLGCL